MQLSRKVGDRHVVGGDVGQLDVDLLVAAAGPLGQEGDTLHLDLGCAAELVGPSQAVGDQLAGTPGSQPVCRDQEPGDDDHE